MSEVKEWTLDRRGKPFYGTKAELRKHNNKLCKQDARAKAAPELKLPLPEGLVAALERVCHAAEFEDPRELLSTVVFNLDRLLEAGDSHQFAQLTKVTVTIGSLDKYLPLIGIDPGETDE